MRVAIIGAGFTGLTAAYQLAKRSHQVFVFEKEKFPGGLAAGFKPVSNGKSWHLEYFFHHLFTSDQAVKKLISELKLSNKLFFKRAKTSIFYQGKISQFDSPFSVLSFPHLTLLDKLRTALVTSFLKFTNDWKKLEKISATDWLKKYYGERAYQILWQPLLKAKFGNQANNISMSWFWARIKKRSFKLGYLEGGFQILINELVREIKERGGKIYLNHQVLSSNDLPSNRFEIILFTTPSIEKIKMLGALNLILVLEEKFLTDGTYWLNINEKGVPFVAIVEHTNFIDPKHYGGKHLLYVGGYYPQNHRYFRMKKEEILKEFLPYLQKINPRFNPQLSPIRYMLYANLYAQPIITVGYSKLIPPHQTIAPNIYLANMEQVYPWDRGINYAIELGEKVAKLITD